MATGALVLAILAVLATRANKKFSQVQTGVSGNFLFKAVYPIDFMTTVVTRSGRPRLFVKLCTAGGHAFFNAGSGDLVTVAGSNPIYLK